MNNIFIVKFVPIILSMFILQGSVLAQNKSKLSIDELENINSSIYNELSKNNYTIIIRIDWLISFLKNRNIREVFFKN